MGRHVLSAEKARKIEVMRRLWDSELRATEIARLVNVKPDRLHQLAREANLPKRGTK